MQNEKTEGVNDEQRNGWAGYEKLNEAEKQTNLTQTEQQ